MLDPMEKVRVARRYLFTRKPFFGSLLAEIDSKGGMYPDPSVATIATNGRAIRWNPTFVNKLTTDEVVGVIAHELMHVGLGHTLRRGKRSQHLWQTATDWAINDVLIKDGFRLPEGVLYPPVEQKEKSAESNHDHLRRLYDDKPPSAPGTPAPQESENDDDDPSDDENEQGAGSGGDGETDDETETSGEQSPDGGESDDEQDENEQDAQGGANGGGGDSEDPQDESDDPDAAEDDDGAVNGNDDADEDDAGQDDTDKDSGSGKPKLDKPKWGEVEDEPDKNGKPMDEVSRDKAIRERAIQLVEAVRAAGKDCPSGLRKLVNEVIEGKADWRQILRQFCNDTMKIDSSWRVPNRRFVGQEVYLPGEDGEGLGEQVVVLDVSGSINDGDLKRFQREMRKQLRELPPTKLHVIWHDDNVLKHVVHEGDYENLDLSGPGGGGTDFGAVTRYLAENHIHSKCMVWFTDLQTYYWPEDPMIPTLWVVWPCRYGSQVDKAPWGMVNLMPQEDD